MLPMSKVVTIPKFVKTISVNENKLRNYYTATIEDKQSIFSFANKRSATDCALFLAHYKNKFNSYPVINKSEIIKIDYSDMHKQSGTKSISEILSEDIIINEEETSDLVDKCSIINLGLVVIHSFGFNDYNNHIDIMFKGSQIEVPERECELSVSDLDDLFEF